MGLAFARLSRRGALYAVHGVAAMSASGHKADMAGGPNDVC
jgi:hypothetical protein